MAKTPDRPTRRRGTPRSQGVKSSIEQPAPGIEPGGTNPFEDPPASPTGGGQPQDRGTDPLADPRLRLAVPAIGASAVPRTAGTLADVQGRLVTGRKLALLARDGINEGTALLKQRGSFEVIDGDEADASAITGHLEEGKAVVFRKLGVAVCSAEPDRAVRLQQSSGRQEAVRLVEDERYIFHTGMNADWLRGYRAAVEHITDEILADGGAGGTPAPDAPADLAAAARRGTQTSTWGIGAILAATSRVQGRGVKLAVLDTGLDPDHPDFAGRIAAARSFVKGENARDGNGHGTHCAGVACGPAEPAGGIARYGVAPGALLHVGKVLNNLGEGVDASILGGIEWALREGCRVISLSLGAPVRVGERPSVLYEQIGRRARAMGAVLIAAAGNDSDRPNGVAPVSHPANCDSIMAVAAIDRRFAVARFSNAGINRGGGVVDVAAPGVGVFSAWPGIRGYRQESGTSMAAPHVSGIAAMLLEARPDLSGDELFRALCRSARPLPALTEPDVGAGLIQAPP